VAVTLQIHTFLISTLDEGERPVHKSAAFHLGKEPLQCILWETFRPIPDLGTVKNIKIAAPTSN
jgi:hypothetical protein